MSEELFRFSYKNSQTIDFNYQIFYLKNKDRYVFHSKSLSAGSCICCEMDPLYEKLSYDFYNMMDLYQNLPMYIIDKIKQSYLNMKILNIKSYHLSDWEIMETLTNIKNTDVVCSDCLWYGPKEKKLKNCPYKQIKCPIFNTCNMIVPKSNEINHTHICNKCNFKGNYEKFEKHLNECIHRKVKCANCFWIGNNDVKNEHKCTLNGPKYTQFINLIDLN